MDSGHLPTMESPERPESPESELTLLATDPDSDQLMVNAEVNVVPGSPTRDELMAELRHLELRQRHAALDQRLLDIEHNLEQIVGQIRRSAIRQNTPVAAQLLAEADAAARRSRRILDESRRAMEMVDVQIPRLRQLIEAGAADTEVVPEDAVALVDQPMDHRHILDIPLPRESPPDRECVACLQNAPFDRTTTLECHHIHCDDCLTTNVRLALGSAPFTPARCCGVISTDLIVRKNILTEDEGNTYIHKLEELTNPKPKIYCFECGTVISAVDRKMRAAECQNCARKTCQQCKSKSHFGPCDAEKLKEARESDEYINQMAESKGWKRCPGCLNIIAKSGGCNHVV